MVSPATLLGLIAMVASAVAAPFQAEAVGPGGTLVVVDPKITYPTQDTVWVVGNQYNVTWDNSDLPPLVNITNVQGQVVLGQFNGDSEKLYLDDPLAQGFLITDSHVSITVPKVFDGDYMIVLLGDSGNQSPQFKIVNNPLSSVPGARSTSIAPSSSVAFTSVTAASSTGTTSPTVTLSSTQHGATNSATSTALAISTPTNATATDTTPQSSQTASSATSWRILDLSLFTFISMAISVVLAL